MALSADSSDSLSGVLSERRRRFFEEMDRDPALRAYVRGLAAAENGGHPEGIVERLVNGADMNGRASLWDEIRSGFYGPVNRGTVQPMASSPDYDAALDRVRAGSNDIGLLTDQGMRNEHRPAARIGVEPTLIRGEWYSPMGPRGLEWKAGVERSAAERAAAVSQGPNSLDDPGARDALTLLPRSLLATADSDAGGRPAETVAAAVPVSGAAIGLSPAVSRPASAPMAGYEPAASLPSSSGDPVERALRLANGLGNASTVPTPMVLHPAHIGANPGALRLAQSAGLYGLGSTAGMATGGAVDDASGDGFPALDTGDNLPETLPSLLGQQAQLIEGRRPAQMFPAGTPELPVPDGMERLATSRGAYHFNPARVTARDVAAASAKGRENDILGLGPLSKDDVNDEMRRTGEPPIVVVERDAMGNEIKAALATPSTAHLQALEIAGAMAPDHVLSIEPVGDVLAGRMPEIDPVSSALRRARAEGGGVDDGPVSTADVRDLLSTIPVRKGGVLPLTEYGDGKSRLDWTAGVPGILWDAFTAPARAYRGEIAPDQMIPEGLNFAGSVALGSAAVPRPRGSVGMGSLKEGASHLDMSPEARMARAREMGLDTKGYHWTGVDFDEFNPHPYRGASFFGRTADDARRGATAGANDGTGTGASKLREVMLPGGEIMGLALTPAERRWWSGLPEFAGEGEITSILENRPSDLSYSAKGMPWYNIYDEKRLPDGGFSYIKFPEPRLSWDEAAKSKYDVYGGEWPHYNPGSERFSSDYAKKHGMSGYTHQDEAGLSIGMVDPTRIRDVNAAFDLTKSSSANLLAANPETSAAPGLGLMAAAKQEPKGFTAYHGSPHDFDKFDMSKIGTGEGAQAYGHGLYFADSEGVARSYRDKLTDGASFIRPDGTHWDPGSLRHLNVRVTARRSGIDAAIDKARELAVPPWTDATVLAGRDLADLEKLRDAGGVKPNPGRMYQVRINADPEHFLDWDKPLFLQSQQVKDALRTFGVKEVDNPRGMPTVQPSKNGDKWTVRSVWGDPAGTFATKEAADYKAAEILRGWGKGGAELAYQNLGGNAIYSKLDKGEASRKLREAGIPGIKYLDQGSRSAGEGSRNYVVFDDKIIDILKKYGLFGSLGMGAAAMSGGDASAAIDQSQSAADSILRHYGLTSLPMEIVP